MEMSIFSLLTVLEETIVKEEQGSGAKTKPRQGMGIGVGLALGAGIGAAMDQIALGVALGMLFGVVFDIVVDKSRKEKNR